MASTERDFQEHVASLLHESGLPLRRQWSFRGTRPDFVAEMADGRVVVLEAKTLDASPGNVRRAEEQARLYQEALGADAALVVLPRITPGAERPGVVSFADLATWLKSAFLAD